MVPGHPRGAHGQQGARRRLFPGIVGASHPTRILGPQLARHRPFPGMVAGGRSAGNQAPTIPGNSRRLAPHMGPGSTFDQARTISWNGQRLEGRRGARRRLFPGIVGAWHPTWVLGPHSARLVLGQAPSCSRLTTKELETLEDEQITRLPGPGPLEDEQIAHLPRSRRHLKPPCPAPPSSCASLAPCLVGAVGSF